MTNRPFSQAYVIRETLRHMERAVAISTQKTVSRMNEFREDPEMLKAVMDTLASLSRLNKVCEDIREHNKNIIGE